MDCGLPGSCPWDSPSKNTRTGNHSLLQGILPTQESSPGLLLCKRILYHLSHASIVQISVGRERGMVPTAQNDGVLLEGSNPLPIPFPNNIHKTVSIQNHFNNKVDSRVSFCSHGWLVGLWRARTSGPWSGRRVCGERRGPS